MKITVDGVEVSSVEATAGALLEAYRAQVAALMDAGRMVVNVSLDGTSLNGDEVTRLLDGEQAGHVLELTTIARGELVTATLVEVHKHLEPLRSGIREVAGALAGSDHTRVFEGLKPVLEIWQGLCEAVDKVCVMSGVAPDTDVGGLTLGSEEQRIAGVFGEIEAALQNADWVALGDLLEYELLPAVDRWDTLVGALLGIMKQDERA